MKSVFLVRDETSQAAVLFALNENGFPATGEIRSLGLTVTVHHSDDETAQVERIVYAADPSGQRY